MKKGKSPVASFVVNEATGTTAGRKPVQRSKDFDATVVNAEVDHDGKVSVAMTVTIDVDLSREQALQLVQQLGTGLDAWNGQHLTGTLVGNQLVALRPSTNSNTEFTTLDMPKVNRDSEQGQTAGRAVVDQHQLADSKSKTLAMPKAVWPDLKN